MPLPAEAPEIPPVIVPIVQVKLPGTDDDSGLSKNVPLQTDAVDAFVTMGFGWIVTRIVVGKPPHDPEIVIGVTIY